MRRKRAVNLLAAACLLLVSGSLAACGAQTAQQGSSAAGEGSAASESDTSSGQIAVDPAYIDSLKEQGYITVGAKTDVPGLGYYDADTDTWSGVEIELAYLTAAKLFDVSAADAKEQELVHFVGVTVADREQQLEDGAIDLMLATYTITDARKERFVLSDSYYTDYIGLMVRYSGADQNPNSMGSADISSTWDLDGKYIAVAKNSTTREDMLEFLNLMSSDTVSPIFMEFTSYSDMFKALKDGRVDVMSVDVSILNGYLDNETKILDDRFAGQHYGGAVTMEHAELIEYVNAAVAEL